MILVDLAIFAVGAAALDTLRVEEQAGVLELMALIGLCSGSSAACCFASAGRILAFWASLPSPSGRPRGAGLCSDRRSPSDSRSLALRPAPPLIQEPAARHVFLSLGSGAARPDTGWAVAVSEEAVERETGGRGRLDERRRRAFEHVVAIAEGN